MGWVLFTIVLGLFSPGCREHQRHFIVLVATIGLAAFALTAGRKFVGFRAFVAYRMKMPEPGSSLTFCRLLAGFFRRRNLFIGYMRCSLFIAGIVIGEAKNLSEESRRIISDGSRAIFVPIFFMNIGLKLDFVRGSISSLWFLCA